MSSKHRTASQVTGGYVEFQAAVLRALPRDINPDVARGWMHNGESLARVLRDALTPDGKSDGETARKFLCPRGEIALPATDPFDPDAFYKSREGLYVWRDFGDRILTEAQPVGTLSKAVFKSYDLVDSANNAEIRAELPNDHIFEDASIFCAYLAGMITRQESGEDGDLLTNGNINIFYVRSKSREVFAVSVHRNAHGRWWNVFADPLGDSRWRAGSRAFSSNSCTLAA